MRIDRVCCIDVVESGNLKKSVYVSTERLEQAFTASATASSIIDSVALSNAVATQHINERTQRRTHH